MIREFFYKYYIDPIRTGQAYTVVDTLTYAIILIIAVYLLYRWMKKHSIPVDRDLVLATLPFIVFGGLMRVVEDTGVITSDWRFLLITPIIFFVIFFIAFAVLITAWVLSRRGLFGNPYKVYGLVGVVLALVTAGYLAYLGATRFHLDLGVLAVILSLAVITTALVYLLIRYGLKWAYAADPLYLSLIFGHMLDASATSYGIDIHPLAYVEQHVVGSNLIALTGTAFSMFPLKLIVLVPGIYILQMYRKDGSSDLFHLIVLAMITVGLAPGVRDMVRMVLYV
jgi:uncharacterized membrane protein